jgi:cell division protein FtsB
MEKLDSRFYRRPRAFPFWNRTRKLIFAGIVTVCLVGVIFGEFGFLRILQLKKEGGRLEAQIIDATIRKRILEERKDRLENDPFTIEKIAREECGLYKPGEKIFLFEYGDTTEKSTDQSLDNFSLNQ